MKNIKKAQKCGRCLNFEQQVNTYYHPFGLNVATCPDCYRWQCQQVTNFKKNRIQLYPELVEVIPHLFLSNEDAALDLNLLQKQGISSVCACGYFLETPHTEIQYKQYLVGDYAEESISKYFNQINEWINQRIQNNKAVLIHCSAGVSRSVTIIIAYLIGNRDMTFDEAFEVVKNKRTEANPNIGFIEQLKNYDKVCKQNTK